MLAKPDLGAVFDASPNPYMVVDRELRYVAVNQAYLNVTTWRRDDLLGRRVVEAFPHDPTDPNNEIARRLVASFERVFATGQPDVLPLIHYRILVHRSGEAKYEDLYWSATHTPILDAAGRVEYVLQHTVNVTELRRQINGATVGSGQVEAGVLGRAEQVQQRNEALDQDLRRLLRVFDQAPAFLSFLRGPEHVYELANVAYDQAVGHRPLIGRKVRDALPEIGDQYFELLDRVFETQQPFVGSGMAISLQRRAGGPVEQRFVDFVYQPILDGQGRSLGVLVLGYDVTEQKQAQVERQALLSEAEAARAEEAVARRRAETVQAELEAIFESFPEALFVGDASGIKRANAAARDMLGYDSIADLCRPQPELALELALRRPDTGAPLPADETPYARALRGHVTRMEVVLRNWRTGADRFVYASGAPIKVGGTTLGAVAAQIDITEQKRAEAEARQLARVLDATRDFVGIADPQGRPMFANEAALRMLGLPDLQAARNLNMLEVFVERQRQRVRDEAVPTALRDGYWEGELLFVHQVTGEEIPVLHSIFPLRDGSGTVTALASITRDLRGQKAAQDERVELLRKEKEARGQAEEANRLKDQFLAIVSHELRTPLTSILGWMQLLKSGKLSPEKRARALETVERNSRVQAQLIDDLLDVSRISSGKLALEIVAVDLAAVVGAAVETVRPVADGRGVRLEVAQQLPAGVVLGDARRLQQVVWNLLSNAVKFTPEGGQVLLRVEQRGSSVEITVADTGAGIAAEFLPHVFERFRQAEAGARRNPGGLGLGLSIVRHVVEAHGGSVRAESDGEGRGATFTVRLPLAAAPPKPARAPACADRELVPPASLAGTHLLVVDDEEDTREYLRTLLDGCQARVTLAGSAAEALEAMRRDRPDVLLSDLGMPGEDGYTLIERVRALEGEGGRTPAVALTAYARVEDRTRAILAGFQDHVPKPIDPAELLAVVASLVEERVARG